MPEETKQLPEQKPNETLTPKFELKEGSWFVDGHKVVKEADLIAAKTGLEGQISQMSSAHSAAIDKAKQDLSDAQKAIAQVTARAQLAEEQARKSGAAAPAANADAEAARKQAESDLAKKSAETAANTVLDLKRKLLLATYPGQLNAEQLSGMTDSQLTAVETTFVALASSRRGPGPYAVPAGGGQKPTTQSEMDRARAVLAATPIGGMAAKPQS